MLRTQKAHEIHEADPQLRPDVDALTMPLPMGTPPGSIGRSLAGGLIRGSGTSELSGSPARRRLVRPSGPVYDLWTEVVFSLCLAHVGRSRRTSEGLAGGPLACSRPRGS